MCRTKPWAPTKPAAATRTRRFLPRTFSVRISAHRCTLKLPPELLQVHAMLCGFLLADEEHWDIPTVALHQQRIIIYIDLSEDRAEFPQERHDGGLGFVAKVTPRTRVERDVEQTASG